METTEQETAEQLQARLADARQRFKQAGARQQKLLKEVKEAGERQRLRNDLECVEEAIRERNKINAYHEYFKELIDIDHKDIDAHDPAISSSTLTGQMMSCRDVHRRPTSGGDTVDFGADVVTCEYSFKIKGMSWLASGVRESRKTKFDTAIFRVGDDEFDIVYHPKGGAVGTSTAHGKQVGSLAIRHFSGKGITFRYKFLVQDASGKFTQWGETGDECHPEWDAVGKAFGPDVQMVGNNAASDTDRAPIGVFGLSHQELLHSKWIRDDTLTVKVELEVKPQLGVSCPPKRVKPKVEVPEPTLNANLLSLLESCKHSDVTFLVDGKQVKAHAAILASRSEVFDRELSCGMRESMSKEIVIEDCDVTIFKALLRFLYTDDLACIEDTVEAMSVEEASSNAASSVVDVLRTPLIQSLLAVSHRYQVSRLQLWCEQKLCEQISTNEVCAILCQAHLHEAKQLEQACLAFIKGNMCAVVSTPAFGRLTEDWPDVMLKINIFVAGISESDAAQVVRAQQEARLKRQLQRHAEDDGHGFKRARSE